MKYLSIFQEEKKEGGGGIKSPLYVGGIWGNESSRGKGKGTEYGLLFLLSSE